MCWRGVSCVGVGGLVCSWIVDLVVWFRGITGIWAGRW